jgi:hypothetical protein
MSIVSTTANYGGSIGDSKQFIKQFIVGGPRNLAVWKNVIYNYTPGSLPGPPLYTTLLTPAVTKTSTHVDIPVYIATDLYVNGTIYGTLATPSDEKIKENIEPISDLKITEFIHLEPKEFTYKTDPNIKHYGFIAQDVEKIYPNLVNNSKNGCKTINYIEIIPLLVAKINAMQKQIDEIHISLT